MRNRSGLVALASSIFLLAFLMAAETLQAAQCPPSNATWWAWTEVASGSPPNNCLGGTGFRCYPFQQRGDWFVRKAVPTCDPEAGACEVELVVPLKFPGARAMYDEDGPNAPLPKIAWFDEAVASACTNGPPFPPPCSPNASIGQCGWAPVNAAINEDEIDTWVEIGALSCEDLPSSTLEFSL